MYYGPIEIEGTFMVNQAYKKKEVNLVSQTNYDFIKFFVPFQDWIFTNLNDLREGKTPDSCTVVL